jgi:hypothetical protein
MRTWASGDGAVRMTWTSSKGEQLPEPVTESDASEFLRGEAEKEKWDGWEIVCIQGGGMVLGVRLARAVRRPAGSHRKLVMGGQVYEYRYNERSSRESGAERNGRNTTFVLDGREVVSLDAVASLLFFLNHEADFRASGLETRETR